MKKIFTCLFFLYLFAGVARGQLIYQPYSYQFYQKLNPEVYSPSTNLHTAVKPFLIGDSSPVRKHYDSLMYTNPADKQKGWIYRKIFDEHLFDEKEKDYTFFADYLTDLQAGTDLINKKSVWLNTRAYQIGGTIGNRFFFYSSGNENQGKFANYENNYINQTNIIPGQAYNRSFTGQTDWAYVTALIGYQATKSLNIVLGEDKTFIGDGYRSVLLSDFAANYPLLRITADFGKRVRYMAMWAYMEDQTAPEFNAFYNNRRKWAAFHYIDWNITNRASIGFFNAVIAEEANNKGQLRNFDINFVDPLYFSSSFGPSGDVPDHTLAGLNGKYKVFDKTTVYGQFLLDQASTGSKKSNMAVQLGLRGSDLFKVSKLNYLFEYNSAAANTYSNQNPIVNYTELNESLGHPYGNNFEEWLGIINYSVGRFDFQGQFNYARFGNSNGNFTYVNSLIQFDNIVTPPGADFNGQGLPATLKYAEGTVAFVINPKYNLRIELGGLYRQEKNVHGDLKTGLITIGLRSSFRNLYHDF
jgi:hypothetical protein